MCRAVYFTVSKYHNFWDTIVRDFCLLLMMSNRVISFWHKRYLFIYFLLFYYYYFSFILTILLRAFWKKALQMWSSEKTVSVRLVEKINFDKSVILVGYFCNLKQRNIHKVDTNSEWGKIPFLHLCEILSIWPYLPHWWTRPLQARFRL